MKEINEITNALKNLEGKNFGEGRCAFSITSVKLWNAKRIYINTNKIGTAYKHVDGTFYYDIESNSPIINIIGTSKEIETCKNQILNMINNLIK